MCSKRRTPRRRKFWPNMAASITLLCGIRKDGSPGKFVLFLGTAGMTEMHGRHVIARDFRCVQEVPLQQDGGRSRRRDCSGGAFGQTLCLPWLPQPGGDSQRQKNPSCANLADWLSSGL